MKDQTSCSGKITNSCSTAGKIHIENIYDIHLRTEG